MRKEHSAQHYHRFLKRLDRFFQEIDRRKAVEAFGLRQKAKGTNDSRRIQ